MEHDTLEIKGKDYVDGLLTLVDEAIVQLKHTIQKQRDGKIDIHFIKLEVKYN